VLVEKSQVIDLRVIGILRFTPDVTPELLDRTVRAVHVSGLLLAPPAVRRAIA
jgi:hypothetical protein